MIEEWNAYSSSWPRRRCRAGSRPACALPPPRNRPPRWPPPRWSTRWRRRAGCPPRRSSSRSTVSPTRHCRPPLRETVIAQRGVRWVSGSRPRTPTWPGSCRGVLGADRHGHPAARTGRPRSLSGRGVPPEGPDAPSRRPRADGRRARCPRGARRHRSPVHRDADISTRGGSATPTAGNTSFTRWTATRPPARRGCRTSAVRRRAWRAGLRTHRPRACRSSPSRPRTTRTRRC
jgi:hypothetical protein